VFAAKAMQGTQRSECRICGATEWVTERRALHCCESRNWLIWWDSREICRHGFREAKAGTPQLFLPSHAGRFVRKKSLARSSPLAA